MISHMIDKGITHIYTEPALALIEIGNERAQKLTLTQS